MIPPGATFNLVHALINRIGSCQISLQQGRELDSLFSTASEPDLDACARLMDEMGSITFEFGESAREGAVTKQQTRRILHRLGGCVAPARAHIALSVDLQDHENAKSWLRKIDGQLASAGAILVDFRDDWFSDSTHTLRDVIVRAVDLAGDAPHVELSLSEHPVFDELVANRFIREFLDEALVNAWKHGQAPVELAADCTESKVAIRVSDGGPGFDPDRVDLGHGMRVLEGSAAALGGDLVVESQPSAVTLLFPVE